MTANVGIATKLMTLPLSQPDCSATLVNRLMYGAILYVPEAQGLHELLGYYGARVLELRERT